MLTIVVALASTATLVACTPVDDVWAKFEAGSIAIKLCDGIAANSIRIDARAARSTEHDVTIWEASSTELYQFEPGAEIVMGINPLGFDEIEPPNPVDPDDYSFYVAVANRDLDGSPSKVLTALFDGSRLADDHWINQDGAAAEHPCA